MGLPRQGEELARSGLADVLRAWARPTRSNSRLGAVNPVSFGPVLGEGCLRMSEVAREDVGCERSWDLVARRTMAMYGPSGSLPTPPPSCGSASPVLPARRCARGYKIRHAFQQPGFRPRASFVPLVQHHRIEYCHGFDLTFDRTRGFARQLLACGSGIEGGSSECTHPSSQARNEAGPGNWEPHTPGNRQRGNVNSPIAVNVSRAEVVHPMRCTSQASPILNPQKGEA